MKKMSKHSAIIATITLLTACGSGGGGSGATAPNSGNGSNSGTNNGSSNNGSTGNNGTKPIPLPSNNPSANDSTTSAPTATVNAKFNDGTRFGNAAAELVNLKPARDANITGAGVKVAVIDSVVRDNAFLPNVASRETYSTTDRTVATGSAATDDHGTHTALALAGSPTSSFRGGIAPNAQIVSAGVSVAANKISEPLVLNAWKTLSNAGVRLFNNSFGSDGTAGLDMYTQAAQNYLNASSETARQSSTIGVMNQIVNNNGLLVFAAGNAGEAQPTNYSLMPLAEPNLAKGLIAVGAVDNNGVLSSYSNKCGDAKNWCMVAAGNQQVAAAGATSTTNAPMETILGTSYAAPQVTGTAALLLQKFPWMSNDNLRTTILTTSTDLGALGVDSVYGWGLLNVGKALNGAAQFAFGDFTAKTDGGSYTFSNDISGTGGLVKDGAGNLTLTGKNTFTGQTNVLAGSLTVTNSTTSASTINNGATMNATNATVASVINNGAFTAKDTGVTINGNFAQGSTGRLNTDIGSKVAVTGSATLGGTVYFDGVKTGYTPANGTQQTVLTASTVNGQFASMGSNPSLLLQGSLGYTPTSVLLNLNRVNTSNVVSTLGLDAAAQRTATSGANLVEASFDNLDANAASNTQSTLGFAGEASTLQQVQSVSTLGQNLSSMAGTVHANSSMLNGLAQAQVVNVLTDKLDTNDSAAFGQYDTLNSQWKGGKYTGGTLTLGVTKAVTSNDNIGLSFNVSDSKWKEGADEAKNDTYGLSAAWKHGMANGFYTKLDASYAYGDKSVNRLVSVGANVYNVSSSPKTDALQVGLMVGKRFNVSTGLSISPELGARFDWMKQRGFKESANTGFALNAESTSQGLPVGVFGLNAMYQFGTKNAYTLGLNTGLEHDFKDRNFGLDARFNGTPNASLAETGAWNAPRTRWYAGLSFSAWLRDNVLMTASYQYKGAKGYNGHSFNVNASVKF